MKKLLLATVVSVASRRPQTSRSKETNMKTGLILIVATLLAATAAHAQSFNCNYAKAPDEVLICQNKDLAQADESMADKFFRLRQELRGGQLRRLNEMQGGWLAARMTCGRDYPCINRMYEFRNAQLLDELLALCRTRGWNCEDAQ
jgi:uncharacterized protein